MITALISFFGGNIFRMLWGEISSWMTKRQDHGQEMDRMRLQGELDAAQHVRTMESTAQQAALAVDVVRVQGDTKVDEIETSAWEDAVQGATKTSGIWVIDFWNGVIRPFVATWSICLITAFYYQKNWILDENGWGLCGAALGIYLADRTLFKRGK